MTAIRRAGAEGGKSEPSSTEEPAPHPNSADTFGDVPAVAPPMATIEGHSLRAPSRPTLISLNDVRDAFPKESEGEALVMDHIEQTDPTGTPLDATDGDFDGDGNEGGRLTATEHGDDPIPLIHSASSVVSALADSVTGMPSSFRAAMLDSKSRRRLVEQQQRSERNSHQGSNSGSMARIDSASIATQRHRRRAVTVEDELFQLTNAILPTQPDHLDGHEEAGNEEDDGQDETRRTPLTQTEELAANARHMFANVEKTVAKEKRQANNGNTDVEQGLKSTFRPCLNQREELENAKEVFRIIRSNKKSTRQYIRITVIWVIFPATALATFLFYVMGNPGAYFSVSDAFNTVDSGTNDQPVDNVTTLAPVPAPAPQLDNSIASYSWFVLFFGVRQVITFGMALGLQVLIVAYYHQASVNFTMVGPMTRLCIIQSRGWPLVMILWAILDFVMLYGVNRFANHWLFFQGLLGVFNANNPSGGFPASDTYRRILIFTICTGAIVSAKRFFIGLRFGKNSYNRYAGRLSKVLRKIVQVARVSRMSELEEDVVFSTEHILPESSEVDVWLERHAYYGREGVNETRSNTAPDGSDSISIVDSSSVVNMNDVEDEPLLSDYHPEITSHVVKDKRPLLTSLHLGNLKDASVSSAQQLKIDELLGEWEDADLNSIRVEEPSLSAVVQFGSSLAVLESDYPFSQAFGFARTRYDVVDCSQRVYSNLLRVQGRLNAQSSIKEQGGKRLGGNGNNIVVPATTLRFHTIALLAIDEHGSLDDTQAKSLMGVFRPTREGDISLLDFCKSIDMIYKEIRILRASAANESRMNAAAESLINFLFYFVLVCIGMAIIGINPAVVLGTLAAFIVSFSFCVSGASSDYIRGLLFILVQRPYDIGDRVAIAGAQDTALGTGSPYWTVKDIGLYHTTILFDASQEYGTLSNGAMANLRILNAARSPRALLQFFMRFGVAVKIETVEEFKERLFDYVRSKPREWLRPVAFRMTRIAAELGYMEYFVLLQHRESWQQIAALKGSLSDVQQFSFQLSSDLAMGYQSPSLPITLDAPHGSDKILGLLKDNQKGTESPAMA